VYNEALLTV